MKILLVTIHNANNYGAVLQAYATHSILSQCGIVSTLDYNNRYLAHHLDLIRFAPTLHGLKMFIHDVLRLPYRFVVISKFKKFIREGQNLTSKLTSKDLMTGGAGNYDAYVCGSDQIWNPEIVSPTKTIDPIFFLEFCKSNAKKISYASSVGHHSFTDDEKVHVKRLLKDFSLISTRESDGVAKLSEILPDREIHHVLDPTLLLTKNEWVSVLGLHLAIPKEKYLLVYTVPRSGLIKKAVKYYAKKLNLKVVAIDQMLWPISNVDMHMKSAGPKEFVELFCNAEFVVTDSFHGVCFAVNFSKPFVAVSAGKRANRISSLLSVLNLNETLVSSEAEFSKTTLKFDFNLISEKLNNEREKSKKILLDSLSSKKI